MRQTEEKTASGLLDIRFKKNLFTIFLLYITLIIIVLLIQEFKIFLEC